jgi:hypothetical protein
MEFQIDCERNLKDMKEKKEGRSKKSRNIFSG